MDHFAVIASWLGSARSAIDHFAMIASRLVSARSALNHFAMIASSIDASGREERNRKETLLTNKNSANARRLEKERQKSMENMSAPMVEEVSKRGRKRTSNDWENQSHAIKRFIHIYLSIMKMC